MTMDYAREDGWPSVTKKGWSAAEFDPGSGAHQLTDAQIRILLELVEKTRTMGLAVTDITREVFDHPDVHDSFADWVRAMKEGQGLFVLKGFPVRERPLDDIWRMYWGIASHFGIPVSQNTNGQLQGTVAVQEGAVGGRVYSTSDMAPFHSDRIDMLVLLCINKAREGGENVFVSALKIWEVFEQERPDLLERLKRGYFQHRNNEEPEGSEPVTPYRVPVFGEVGGLRSVLASGNARVEHQELRFPETIDDKDREALRYFFEVAGRPELALHQMLEPGEAVFINNMEILHSRAAFHNGSEPEEKRLLLRLWLQGRPVRPIPPEMRVIKNPSGMLGIEKKTLAPTVAA
jgi:alpha-ketoglutarate-dependent taurine dioxygenase